MSLKTARNHFRVLKNFTESVELYFISTTYKIIGIQLWVSGKLGGKMRKSKYSYTLGVVHMQTIKTPLSYNISLCYTKFGVLSVKV